MSYSIEAATADCYPGTSCLVNKLGIQDEVRLAETEAAVVLGKASLLDQEPIPGVFDFSQPDKGQATGSSPPEYRPEPA